MEYNFREIEKRWQSQWVKDNTYHVTEDASKEKFYVLNMFPYPSGAGLHVGHPLGYIASDIYARYKRLKGFNVLNPMGYAKRHSPSRNSSSTSRRRVRKEPRTLLRTSSWSSPLRSGRLMTTLRSSRY